jgi:hypothetical protein
MSTSANFAERVWLAVSPDGRECQVALRVEAPLQQDRGEWSCAVSLGALDERSDTVAGMDSWQALEQAMFHVAKRIQSFERLGWRFYWGPEREVASPSELSRGV